MTKESKILVKLQEIFRIVFDDDELKIDRETYSNHIEEWDSLNQIKIILACEKEFSVSLNPRIINNFENVGEMIDHLKSKNAKI